MFTRAVDVARISDIVNSIPSLLGGNDQCNQDTYYNIAEATWENMQQEITQWINNNGGHAVIGTKKAVRVDKDKIKSLLESNETISQIPCN